MASLIDHIDRVTFQLSNRCPFAREHEKCPAHLACDVAPENMAGALVYEVLAALGTHEYDGAIGFHSFSEPLADPHLFSYIESAKLECPKCRVVLYSSGWNLDGNLLVDLREAGVYRLNVTAYSEAEYGRLWDLLSNRPTPDIRLKRCQWVTLLDQYERKPIPHDQRCYAPLADLCITAGGKIGLCCRDWEHRFDLVDLTQVPFEQAMLDENHCLRDLYAELASATRTRAICQRCDHARWWNAWRGAAPTPKELNA